MDDKCEIKELRVALADAAAALYRAYNFLHAINKSEPTADRKIACDDAGVAWTAAVRALHAENHK